MYALCIRYDFVAGASDAMRTTYAMPFATGHQVSFLDQKPFWKFLTKPLQVVHYLPGNFRDAVAGRSLPS